MKRSILAVAAAVVLMAAASPRRHGRKPAANAQGMALCAGGSVTKVAAPPGQTVSCALAGGAVITYPDAAHLFKYSSTGTTPAPLLTSDNLLLLPDPNGPNALQVRPRQPGFWNLTRPGQQWTVTLSFTVANSAQSGLAQLGGAATGDGQLSGSDTIGAAPAAVTSITCTSAGCPPYGSAAAYASGSYAVTFTFSMSSGANGTASLGEWSQHFAPVAGIMPAPSRASLSVAMGWLRRFPIRKALGLVAANGGMAE